MKEELSASLDILDSHKVAFSGSFQLPLQLFDVFCSRKNVGSHHSSEEHGNVLPC